MTEILIGGKTYKVEYSVEAALYGNCTEKVTEFLAGGTAQDGKEAIKNFVSQLADLPKLALEMFYAGLMEYHGELGDRTVLSIVDARVLMTKLIKENKDKELGSFYGVVSVLLSEMENNGFFDMIGLKQITNNLMKTAKRTAKAPQDHKKKNA